ncbi:hypothetical protein ES703_76605 [subsurface metagenome]
MAYFQGEGKIRERFEQVDQIFDVGGCVDERPGKLDQDGSQPAFRSERLDSKLKSVYILLGKSLSLVSEHLMELD